MAFQDKSNFEIERELLLGPHRTCQKAKEALALETRYKLLKAQYERQKSETYLKLKAIHKLDKPTIKELESMTEKDCYEKFLEVIQSEAAWKVKVHEWQEAKDCWDASRSALKFRVAEMQSEVRHT